MKNFAVILSGCGHMDGSEIHEATMSLWAINKNNCNYHCFAPNINQHHVLNHLNGDEMAGTRNILIEAGRIARGRVNDIREYKAENYDGFIIPGGLGVIKNFSNFAFEGENFSVLESVAVAINATHQAKKPIGALCIAPTLLAKLIPNCLLTIGNNQNTKETIIKIGAKHQTTTHGEIVVDTENKLVTTPCYMLVDARVDQIGDAADALVKQMLKML
ncbi:MAG: isoprenoid biosynthesis glyoxalase ElbB [Desulfotalea sp.]